jgi:hypothetical protein
MSSPAMQALATADAARSTAAFPFLNVQSAHTWRAEPAQHAWHMPQSVWFPPEEQPVRVTPLEASTMHVQVSYQIGQAV